MKACTTTRVMSEALVYLIISVCFFEKKIFFLIYVTDSFRSLHLGIADVSSFILKVC